MSTERDDRFKKAIAESIEQISSITPGDKPGTGVFAEGLVIDAYGGAYHNVPTEEILSNLQQTISWLLLTDEQKLALAKIIQEAADLDK
jgi:hypothetical protein